MATPEIKVPGLDNRETGQSVDISGIGSEDNQLKEIPLQMIDPNPEQPREQFDKKALKELADSIKKNGVLQPILVRPEPEKHRYFLIAGERRWRAAKMAGLRTVPAVVRDRGTDEDLELAITENLLREDLNPIEEAESLAKLKAVREYSDRQVAEVTGKARTSVVEVLKLNRLPDSIKDECRHTDTPPSRTLLLHITRQGDQKEMLKAWKKYQRGQYSILQARQKRAKKGKEQPQTFRWKHQTKDFVLSVKFHKSEASEQEVLDALQSALDSIRNQEPED